MPELFFADNSGAGGGPPRANSEEILTELLTLAVEKEKLRGAQYIQTHLDNEKKKAPSSTTELPYFYTPNVATTLALSEEEARHAVSVLRLREGDAIRVTDGEGGHL